MKGPRHCGTWSEAFDSKGSNRARNAPRFNMLSIHRLEAPLAGQCFKVAAKTRLDTGSSHHLTPKACRT